MGTSKNPERSKILRFAPSALLWTGWTGRMTQVIVLRMTAYKIGLGGHKGTRAIILITWPKSWFCY